MDNWGVLKWAAVIWLLSGQVRQEGRAHNMVSTVEYQNNNNCRNGSCLTWLATSLEEKRRWLIIDASPRGQCSK